MGTVLPQGWAKRFTEIADLDKSFQELRGHTHFFAETMRGRIRSLQLRFREAWRHFDRASELIDEFEEDKDNLVRQFLLEIYRFDNALTETPVDPDTDVPLFDLPSIDTPWTTNSESAAAHIDLPRILSKHQDVKRALDQRRQCEALLRLHLGQCKEAEMILQNLIGDNPGARPAQLAAYYLGLAACQETLGRREEAERNIQNASLAASVIGEALSAATAVSQLIGIHRFLEQPTAAEEWEEFLDLHVKCPQVTKEIFLRRAELISGRCREHSRPVVL